MRFFLALIILGLLILATRHDEDKTEAPLPQMSQAEHESVISAFIEGNPKGYLSIGSFGESAFLQEHLHSHNREYGFDFFSVDGGSYQVIQHQVASDDARAMLRYVRPDYQSIIKQNPGRSFHFVSTHSHPFWVGRDRAGEMMEASGALYRNPFPPSSPDIWSLCETVRLHRIPGATHTGVVYDSLGYWSYRFVGSRRATCGNNRVTHHDLHLWHDAVSEIQVRVVLSGSEKERDAAINKYIAAMKNEGVEMKYTRY